MMRFFKHFCDEHDSEEVLSLREEFGSDGYMVLFILRELCMARLEKERDEMLTESDCVFRFHSRLLREKLRLSDAKIERILNACATLNLFSFQKVKSVFEIAMPNLLKILDRDAKRPRPRRGQCAASARLETEEDKDKDKEGESGVAAPPNFQTKPQMPIDQVYAKLQGMGMYFDKVWAAWPKLDTFKTQQAKESAARALLCFQGDPIAVASFHKAVRNVIKRVNAGRFPQIQVWDLDNFVTKGHWKTNLEEAAEVDVEQEVAKVKDALRHCNSSNYTFERLLKEQDLRLLDAVNMTGGAERIRMEQWERMVGPLKANIRKAYTKPLPRIPKPPSAPVACEIQPTAEVAEPETSQKVDPAALMAALNLKIKEF